VPQKSAAENRAWRELSLEISRGFRPFERCWQLDFCVFWKLFADAKVPSSVAQRDTPAGPIGDRRQ
jgi:hypothetical protein